MYRPDRTGRARTGRVLNRSRRVLPGESDGTEKVSTPVASAPEPPRTIEPVVDLTRTSPEFTILAIAVMRPSCSPTEMPRTASGNEDDEAVFARADPAAALASIGELAVSVRSRHTPAKLIGTSRSRHGAQRRTEPARLIIIEIPFPRVSPISE